MRGSQSDALKIERTQTAISSALQMDKGVHSFKESERTIECAVPSKTSDQK